MRNRKVLSTLIALSMTFSVFSALLLTENASAAASDKIFDGVAWQDVLTEDFEEGQQYIEKNDSGLRTSSDTDGDGTSFSSYTNNSGESMGVSFKRIEQGNGIPSTYIQTRPSLVSGYDTSKEVRIDFDMAKSYTTTTVTIIAVQGDVQSGTSNTYSTNAEDLPYYVANEQWLFSFEDGIIYGYNGSSWPTVTNPDAAKTWNKFSLIIDCDTDTFDVYRNGTKIIDDYDIGVNFSSISSFKVLTKPSGPSKKKYETLIDNVRFYVGSSASGWTQVFYEDFEDSGMKVIEKGNSGYRGGSDNDGNNTLFSAYTNNSGDSLGTQFKRIAQGNNIESRHIQTRPSLTSGFDTSGKVKFEFDMAKSNTEDTKTIIAVQGDCKSGTSNSESEVAKYKNEQWLFSLEKGVLWAATPVINNDWTEAGTYTTPNTWDKYTLIIDTGSDTYDMYINGVQKTSGYGMGVDFGNIDSLKILTKVTSKPNKAVETLVDNIRFSKETAPGTWTEIFFEDFEASDVTFIEQGNSGYRLPSDADGNGKVYSTYPNPNSTQFKRLEQANGAPSKYIQTDPVLLDGYDTSAVKVEFDMAMSETYYPETIIAIQGDASGSTNTVSGYVVADEQWLFSIAWDQIWAFEGSGTLEDPWPSVTPVNDHMKQRWYHFILTVDCDTDTYSVWYNGDKVVDDFLIGRDFNSIDSFKIVTKQTPPKDKLKKYVETALDNIVVSIAYPETAPAETVSTYDSGTAGEFTDLDGNIVTLSQKYGIAKFSLPLVTAGNDYAIVASDTNGESKAFDIDFGSEGIEVSGTASFFAIVKGGDTHEITSIKLIAVEK